MAETLNDTDTIAESIWVMIKNNPNIESSEIEKDICKLKHTTTATVRTLLSQMTISGIINREKIDGKRTLTVNNLFPNKDEAIRYSYLFKKYETYKEEKNIRFFFLNEELDKIDSLRIELFLKTGLFYKHEQLFMHLLNYRENDILERSQAQETEVLPEHIQSSVFPYHKTNEIPIVEIEKPSAMDKLLSFFKNMKFSYP